MMKKLFVLLSLITALLASCSGDDESNFSIDGLNTPASGTSSSEEDDNAIISVKFLLQDENGVEKYTFNKNENIIFRLDFKNNGEEIAVLPSPIDVFGNDIFHVYSSNGEDFGNPFDVLILDEIAHLILYPHITCSFLCPWINHPNSEIRKPMYFSFEIDHLRPLPTGKYYSSFSIKLDSNRIVTFKKSFEIV